jgi:formylglycine-generating enzyme required for sulfatase activity
MFRTFLIINLFIAGILCLIPTCVFATSSQLSAQEREILKLITESNKANRSLIKSFDANYNVKIESNGASNMPNSIVSKSGRYAFSGNKILSKETIKESNSQLHFVKNGSKIMVRPSQPGETIGLVAIGTEGKCEATLGSPDPWVQLDGGISIQYDQHDARKYGKIQGVTPVEINNEPCIEVNLLLGEESGDGKIYQSEIKIWYSADKGYLPIKSERSLKEQNGPLFKGQIDKIATLDVGGSKFYVPVQYSDTTTIGTQVTRTLKYGIEENTIKINPDLADDLFQIDIHKEDQVVNLDLQFELQGPGGRDFLYALGDDIKKTSTKSIQLIEQDKSFKTISLCDNAPLELIYIPGGAGVVGSPEDEIGFHEMLVNNRKKKEKPARNENESTPHKINIEKGFYIGKYEISIKQFRCFMKEYHHPLNVFLESANIDTYPAAVTWEQADAFCTWLGKRTNLKVRLPNEIEWEYACRGGATTRFFWGEEEKDAGKYANVADESYDKKYPQQLYCFHSNDGYSGLAPVGRYLPNRFGLYDMIGNVSEWCSDQYKDMDNKENPNKDGKLNRVVRGGDYMGMVDATRCASRGQASQDDNSSIIGFRIIIEQNE